MEELEALERRGWEALCRGEGADFDEGRLTDDALMVFAPGVLDRAASLEAMRVAQPWSEFSMEDVRYARLGPDAGAITYSATARREGQPEYRAYITSVYVRDGGGWKLAIHQHTPVGAG